jgi:hypothetical protein
MQYGPRIAIIHPGVITYVQKKLQTKDWPEWLTVENGFDTELAWACVQEATFVANLARLYPKLLLWYQSLCHLR